MFLPVKNKYEYMIMPDPMPTIYFMYGGMSGLGEINPSIKPATTSQSAQVMSIINAFLPASAIAWERE